MQCLFVLPPQIDPLLVLKDWYLKELSADKGHIHNFILDNKDLLKVLKGI